MPPPLSPEMLWLLHLLRSRLNLASLPPPPLPVNPPAFEFLALYHRVGPLVQSRLAREIPTGLDASHLRRFDKVVQHNQQRALRLLLRLAELQQQFDVADIPFLTLKGIILSHYLHDDISMRMAGDLDLWVPEPEADRVHTFLVTHGYTAKTGYGKLPPHLRKKYRATLFHQGYLHASSGLSVEIHWRPALRPQMMRLTFEEAFAQKEKVHLQKLEIPTLSPVHHLTFLYIHGARHLWERIGWLCDLAVFHQKHPALAWSDLARHVSERAVLSGQALLAEFSGQTTHPPISPAVQKLSSMARAHLHSAPTLQKKLSSFQAIRHDWLLDPTWSYRIRILTTHLLGPEEWHRLPLPSALFWLYLFLRPFFWIRRKWESHVQGVR